MSKENKLIPELRFPEFVKDGVWEEKELSDVCEITNGKANAQDHIEEGLYPLFDRSEIIKATNNYIFDCEAVIIPGEGMRFIPKYYEGKFNLHQRAYALKDFSCIGQFVYYSMFHRSNLISQKAVQSTVLSLRLPILQSFPIEIPSNPQEQQKIASCLSSLDELIAAHNDKLEVLKDHKKGLMQNLFPPANSSHCGPDPQSPRIPPYRFPEFEGDGEWSKKKLGDKEVAFIVSEKISINKLNIETYISTENMLPDFSGVSAASKLPATGNFTKFKIGDILISNIRPYLKKVWKSDKVGGASNDVIVFRSGTEVLNEFLEFILKNEKFINYVMDSAKGVKMPRGDKDSMLNYTVFIPSKIEQQKIASCLSALDALITAQSEKIEQLQQHKKGLIQGLFPKMIK